MSIVSLEKLKILDACDGYGETCTCTCYWWCDSPSLSGLVHFLACFSHTQTRCEQNLENDSLHKFAFLFFSAQYLNEIAPVNFCHSKRRRGINFGLTQPKLILWAFRSAVVEWAKTREDGSGQLLWLNPTRPNVYKFNLEDKACNFK